MKEGERKCLDLQDVPLSYSYVSGISEFDKPDFNPNNSNQIVYLSGGKMFEPFGLTTFDLLTKVKDSLIGVWYSGNPRWGRNGWIITEDGSQIVKMKYTGDSLQIIQPKGGCRFPTWDFFGDNYIFQWQPYQELRRIELTSSADNAVFDSIFLPMCVISWSEDNIIAGVYGCTTNEIQFLQAYPLASIKRVQIDLGEEPGNDYISDLKWIPGTKDLLLCGAGGIYRFNYETNLCLKVKDGCLTNRYATLSVSGDGQKVVTSVHRFVRDDTYKQVRSENEIYIMDIDGSNEKLLLPSF